MSFLKQTIDCQQVLRVTLFVRDMSPPCHKCEEARKWIETHLQRVPLREYSMNKDTIEWADFLSIHPGSIGVPQVLITMKNGSILQISSYEQLTKIFPSSEEVKEAA